MGMQRDVGTNGGGLGIIEIPEARGGICNPLRFDVEIGEPHAFNGSMSMRGVGASRRMPPP
jgi:hypothetical protein